MNTVLLNTYYTQFTWDAYSQSFIVGIEQGTLLSCVNDIAAGTQHTVAVHLAKRTHRAILFCKENGLLPSDNPILVSTNYNIL